MAQPTVIRKKNKKKLFIMAAVSDPAMNYNKNDLDPDFIFDLDNDMYSTIKIQFRTSILLSALSMSGKSLRVMNMLYYRHYYIDGDLTNTQIVIFTNCMSYESWVNFCTNCITGSEWYVYTYKGTKDNLDLFNTIGEKSIVIFDDLSEKCYREFKHEINTMFNVR